MRRILSLVLAASLFAVSCTKGDTLQAKEDTKELSVSVPAAAYSQRVKVSIDLVAAVQTFTIIVAPGQTIVAIPTTEPNACCPRILSIERD